MTNTFLRSLDARWPALRLQAGSTIYVALHALADIATSVILVILLARLLPPEGLGQYNYLYALAGMTSVVLMLGMKTAIQRAAAREENFLLGGTLYQAKFLPLFWTIFTAVIYFLRPDLFTPTILLIALAASLFYMADNYIYFLFGQQRFREGAWRKVIVDGSILIGVLSILAITSSPTLAVLTYFTVAALIHGLFFWETTRRLKKLSSHNEGSFHFGKQLSLLNVLGVARLYFDRIIVGSFLGLAPLAFYSIAYAYGDLLTSAGKVVASIVFPASARLKVTEVARAMRRYLPLLLAVFIMATIGMVVLAETIVRLFFSTGYEAVIPYARLLPLVILPKALGTIFARVLEARGESGPIYRVNLASYALELILIAALTPLYGLPGLIIGEAIAYVFFFTASTVAVMISPLRGARP